MDNKNCQGCSGCNSQRQAAHNCGKDGSCGGCGCQNREIAITEREKDFLLLLAQLPFLPLAQFFSKSIDSEQANAMTLASVYLETADDSLDTILETGALLRDLEGKRLITLDYDKPLQNYDYTIFEESKAFKDFCQKQAVSGQPIVERGSIALTALGQEVLDSMEIFL